MFEQTFEELMEVAFESMVDEATRMSFKNQRLIAILFDNLKFDAVPEDKLSKTYTNRALLIQVPVLLEEEYEFTEEDGLYGFDFERCEEIFREEFKRALPNHVNDLMREDSRRDFLNRDITTESFFT